MLKSRNSNEYFSNKQILKYIVNIKGEVRKYLNPMMIRDKNLERLLNIQGELYLEFEGANPTGTQKDRIAVIHARLAKELNYDVITVGSCGNYGVAIAYFAKLFGLKAVVVIPKGYHATRFHEFEEYGARIVRIEGMYEDAVTYSKILAKREGWYDANPGLENREINMVAYSTISDHIFRYFNDSPDTVSVAVGNGTTLAGIFFGFEELYRNGFITHIPRMIAGSTPKDNAVIHSFLMGSESAIAIPPEKIHETTINEPLVNYYAFDGDAALHALRKSNGFAEYVSDYRMLYLSRLLKRTSGLNVLPASTAALGALINVLKKLEKSGELTDKEHHVVVLTARNF